jgi:hypothetical protein
MAPEYILYRFDKVVQVIEFDPFDMDLAGVYAEPQSWYAPYKKFKNRELAEELADVVNSIAEDDLIAEFLVRRMLYIATKG